MKLFKYIKKLYSKIIVNIKLKYSINKINLIQKIENIEKELLIYVVEDDKYYLKLTIAKLQEFGYNNIKGFLSGEELMIDIEGKKRPDIIIMDYLIEGGMDASEILNKLKKYKLNTYIIILSGQGDVEKATNIIKEGANDYLIKNNMTYFNLENNLLKYKNTTIIKLENKFKNRKTKLIYQLTILIIWIILILVLIF